MAETVLDVRDMETQFATARGVVRAVRGVSFGLRTGEKLGVVGESGSGKSALALSTLGLIEPPGRVVAGEVRLHGQVLDRDSERRWDAVRGRHMALVYQDPLSALDPVKSVGDQIGEAIGAHHPRVSRSAVRGRVVELLREVGVPNPEARAEAYPHQYSGGMRQRVVIAMAVANEPDVIIADEPTTALDVTTQAQVLDLLDRLASEHGSAVILITHNMGVVAEFCDRVLVMYAGRVVEEASTESLFSSQAHPYTEALLAAVVRPDRIPEGPLPTIDGAPPALDDLPPGCSFAPRCPLGQALCTREEPPTSDLTSYGRPGSAECHFAAEQLERTSTP